MPGFHKGACAKPQNYANGGFVPKSKREGVIRGPGTGTSDSIQKEIPEGSYIMPADSTQQIGDQALSGLGKGVTAHVSNGEYQIPPEQVHAIGVQALDRLKSATHTPVPEPRGFKPGLFFDDGGEVKWDGTDVTKAAALGTGAAAYGANAALAPAAAKLGTTPLKLAGNVAKEVGQGVVQAARAPGAMSGLAKAAGPVASLGFTAADAFETPTEDYRKRFGMETKDPSFAGDLGVRALGAASDLGNNMTLGLAGKYFRDKQDKAAQVPASAPATPNTPPAPAKVAPPSTPVYSTTPPASSVPIKAGGGESAQDQTSLPNNIIKEGKNSYSGVNIGPDATLNGKPFGSASGTVSTLDNAAMQTLSDRYALQDMARGAALAQAQPLSAGFHPNTGLADERLTDGKQSELISLASTPMKGSQNGQLTANQLRVLADIQNHDANRATESANAAMRDALSRDLNAQNNAAAAQRALLSETGANQRFAATNALDQQKFKLAQEYQGYQTRALKRQEDLTAKWEAAQTPEEKSEIAQQIRALSGRSDAATWKPVVLQGGTDAMGNRTESVLAAVNEATGEMRRYDDVAKQAMPPGLAVGAPSKQADGVYQLGNKRVTIKSGKVTGIE